MKYIIDVPCELIEDDGLLTFRSPYADVLTDIHAEPYTEPDRKDIEDGVWEFLDFLFTGMSAKERYECFDNVFAHRIVSTMTYQEAKSKYEAWKKQNDEIHVGDEVENASHKKGIAFNHCISPSSGLEYVRVLYMDDDSNSFISAWEKNDVCKTGRHFDEVAELLEKMRGDSDE